MIALLQISQKAFGSFGLPRSFWPDIATY